MHKGRLEAFSDGVLAIILTIMVLELKVPHSPALADLLPLAPVFLSYVLSFAYVGIYWTNHHHLFQVVEKVNGRVLWANNHLLFWLSILPFVTAWAGENHFEAGPVALYGLVLLGCAMAYWILTRALLAEHTGNARLAAAVKGTWKEKISALLYGIAVACAFFLPALSLAIYLAVALVWIIPDARMEKAPVINK